MNRSLNTFRQERLSRIREQIHGLGVECCLLSLGAELPWCIGYEAMPLERPTVLVLPSDGDATLVVPALEAPRVDYDPALCSLRPWDDSQDAIAVIAELVGSRSTLAMSDHAFSMLLLDLQAALPRARWQKASSVIGPLRAVKDDHEIAALSAAAKAADRVGTALLSGEIALIGRTEIEVSQEISRRLIAEGHAKVNFAIVGSGENAASPHHEPSARIIGRGETVVCDFGGALRLDGDIGYCSDITRTVVTGEPAAEIVEAYAVLEKAQAAAVKAVRPGVSCESIDLTGRSIIDAAGFGENFMHRIGHGIGAEAHEDPYIVIGNRARVVPGNAFSIEPGIYIEEGLFGARIEDIVVVTEAGGLSLNQIDHSLQVVEA